MIIQSGCHLHNTHVSGRPWVRNPVTTETVKIPGVEKPVTFIIGGSLETFFDGGPMPNILRANKPAQAHAGVRLCRLFYRQTEHLPFLSLAVATKRQLMSESAVAESSLRSGMTWSGFVWHAETEICILWLCLQD